MRKIGKVNFPENHEDYKEWKPLILRSALASTVLVVAKTRVEGAWSAYCLDVPGKNHDCEVERVLQEGDKVSERIARVMFPYFIDIPYAK